MARIALIIALMVAPASAQKLATMRAYPLPPFALGSVLGLWKAMTDNAFPPIWLDRALVDRLRVMRGVGESCRRDFADRGGG